MICDQIWNGHANSGFRNSRGVTSIVFRFRSCFLSTVVLRFLLSFIFESNFFLFCLINHSRFESFFTISETPTTTDMDTANSPSPSSPDPVALGPPFQLQQGQKAKGGRGRGHSVSTVPVHHSDIPSPTHSRSKSASVSAASFPTLPTLSPPIHSPTLSITATVSHSRRSSWWRREFSSESNPTVPARPWHATATDKPHATPIAKEAALVPAEQTENWDITRKVRVFAS